MSKRGNECLYSYWQAGRSITQNGSCWRADVFKQDLPDITCPNIGNRCLGREHWLSTIPSDHPERPATDPFAPALHPAASQQ